MGRKTLGVALLAAGLAFGCAERADHYNETLGLSGPLVIDDHAVWISRGRRAVLILEPQGRTLRTVHLSGIPTAHVELPDAGSVAVLSSEEEGLDIIEVRTAVARSYALGSPFDSFSVSDDGGFAVARFSGNATGVLSNAAEIAVVDLTADPSDDNPVRRTISSAGGSPTGVDISPPFADGRRLALIRSTNHLAVVDLSNPSGVARSIPLVPPGSGANVHPDQVLFSSAGNVLEVFVRVSGLGDVMHLKFDGSTQADGAPKPILNQFATGSTTTDMALYTGQDGALRLLTVDAGGPSVTIVDVVAAQSTTIPLSGPATRVLLYDGLSGREALLYPVGGASPTFHRLELEQLAIKKSKAVSSHTLVGSIGDIVPVANGQWFLVTHQSGGTTVTLVEGAGNNVLPFTGAGSVGGATVSPDGQAAFLLTFAGGASHLSRIDVATGHPESRELEGSGHASLHLVGQNILIAHNNARGAVTIVPDGDLQKVSIHQLNGFGFHGILDEEGSK